MRTRIFATLIMLLAISLVATAGSVSFTYEYTNNGVSATGTLTGNMVSSGVYDITSGTISIAGSSIDGSGILVPILPNGNFYTGGGTILSFSPGWNTDLYIGTDPQIDPVNGAFTFDLTSGPGAGNGIFIGAIGAGNYQDFGGNWDINHLNGGGSFTATASPVPEPGSLLLLGTGFGLCGFGIVLKKIRYRTARATQS